MLTISIAEIQLLLRGCTDGVGEGVENLFPNRDAVAYYEWVRESCADDDCPMPQFAYQQIEVGRILTNHRIGGGHRMWFLSSIAEYCPDLVYLAARLYGRPKPEVYGRNGIPRLYGPNDDSYEGEAAWIGELYDRVYDLYYQDHANFYGSRHAFDLAYLYRFAIVADRSEWSERWNARHFDLACTSEALVREYGYWGQGVIA